MPSFSDAAPNLPGSLSSDALSSLLSLAGHYRIDRLQQPVVEDLRQRLSRRGVSLAAFRRDYLPILHAFVAYGVSLGSPKVAPDLFGYQLPPLQLAEVVPPWLSSFSEQNEPATVRRYYSILERSLLPYFGQTDLQLLDGVMLEQYRVYYLEKGGAPSSFQFHPRILYGILDFYVSRAIDASGLFEDLPKPLLLKELAPLWLSSIEGHTPPDQMERYRSYLIKDLLPQLGFSDVRKFNQRRVQDYQRALRHSHRSLKNFPEHIALLNQIRQFAVSSGFMESAPPLMLPEKFRPIAASRPTPELMSHLLHMERYPDVLIIRLAWQLGLHYKEIRLLQWKHVDLVSRTAHVSGRSIPIPEDLAAYLSERVEFPDAYVVHTTQKQGPLSVPYLFYLTRNLLRPLHMNHLSLTDFRHDYAIRLLEAGHPAEEVAGLCGYQDLSEVLCLYADFIAHEP